MSDSVTIWTVAFQVPLSMEFSRQILEWVAMPFSRGSSWPRDQTCISCGSYICYGPRTFLTSLVAQIVKCLPTMRETRVQSLCWEDPLEKEMANHCSTLVWKIPLIAEPGGLQSTGSQRVRHNWATSLHFTSLHLLDIVGSTCFHPPLPLWAIRSKTQYNFHYCIFSTFSRDHQRRGTQYILLNKWIKIWVNPFIPKVYTCQVKVKVTQLRPPLCNPMDRTIHGTLQGKILEWVAFPFSRASS